MARARYIAVAGNIGCGKSTLVDFVCRTFGVQPFFEPNADNPYLADFYGDMKRWAFHSQIYFLTHKFRIHQELGVRRNTGGGGPVVQDRTIYEDAEIFARYLRRRGFISARDFGVYQDLYKSLLVTIEPPDLMIYLRASVRTIRKRIRLRRRAEEQDIPVAYVRSLSRLYEDWQEGYDKSPKLIIDTDRLDYLSDLVHRLDLLKTIEKHLR